MLLQRQRLHRARDLSAPGSRPVGLPASGRHRLDRQDRPAQPATRRGAQRLINLGSATARPPSIPFAHHAGLPAASRRCWVTHPLNSYVGLSNVVTPPQDVNECGEALGRSGGSVPGSPLCGYGQPNTLGRALSWGFEAAGPLTVWLRRAS